VCTFSTGKIFAQEIPPVIAGLSWQQDFDQRKNAMMSLAESCKIAAGSVTCSSNSDTRYLHTSDTRITIGCYYFNGCTKERYEILNAILRQFDILVERTVWEDTGKVKTIYRSDLSAEELENFSIGLVLLGQPLPEDKLLRKRFKEGEIQILKEPIKEEKVYLDDQLPRDFSYTSGIMSRPIYDRGTRQGCVLHNSGVELCVDEKLSVMMNKNDYDSEINF